MNASQIVDASKRIVEYRAIVRYFDECGMYEVLERAHCTPITEDGARELVELFDIECRITARTRRGRAYPPKKNHGYAITLPHVPGVGFRRLRVGLVLHEIAHVLDHRKRFAAEWKSKRETKMNHGIGFRKRFAELLQQWAAGEIGGSNVDRQQVA